MDKKRRAERLIVMLRWLVIPLGMVAVSDDIPLMRLAIVMAAGTLVNAIQVFWIADEDRFNKYQRQMFLLSRILDAGLITYLVADSNPGNSAVYLLYWFVLVSIGFSSSNFKKLAVATCAIILVNAAASYRAAMLTGHAADLMSMLGTRSAIVVFGFLVSAYVSKSRSQEDLSTDRGSYLHAILDCGAKLTSLRSVHELAMYVLKSATTHSGAGGGELLLLNDETQELECEAFHSTAPADSEKSMPSEALMRSYAKWVVNSGREFIVRTSAKTEEEEGVASDDHPAMSVPLLWQSSNSNGETSVLGVLIVWGKQGEDFGDDALDILRIFGAIAAAAIVNLRLYTNLQKSFLRTLQSLANGLEARDEYTRGHSERVMQVSCLVANELSVPAESIESLRMAAQLHDIGKIGVPDGILKKAGKLTVEEWETMRRHPLVSEEICRPLGLAPEILFLIKHHHERIDSKGYPDGLPPQEQPLLQRILVVADSFDAMRSSRPYRDRMPEEDLISELNRSAGRTMDPTVVDAVRRLMTRGDMDAVYEDHDRATDCTVRNNKNIRKAA